MSSHLLQCRTVRFAGRSPRCYRGGWFEQNAEPYSNLHGEVWVSFEEGTVEQRLTVEMKCDAEVMTKFTMQRFKQLRYSTSLQQLQLLNLMKLWHCHKEGHGKAYQGELAYVPKPGLSIGIPDHAHRMIVNVILTANIQTTWHVGFVNTFVEFLEMFGLRAVFLLLRERPARRTRERGRESRPLRGFARVSSHSSFPDRKERLLVV